MLEKLIFKPSISKNQELSRKEKYNKLFLKMIIVIIILTIVLKLIVSILLDLGFYNGKVHLGFSLNPKHAFANEFREFQKTNPGSKWIDFLAANPFLEKMLLKHPHIFWMLTQFTWLTTFGVAIVFIFRYFKFGGNPPKWLRWTISQRTLSTMTMYESIVGIIFWTWMFNTEPTFSPLETAETTTTILVHAVVPILVILYSFIHIVLDKKASMLRSKVPLLGMIYPTIYLAYYLLISFIWNDPYPISRVHNSLSFESTAFLSKSEILVRWVKLLWMAPLVLLTLYSMLGISTAMHNIILMFNKKYDPLKDYQAMVQIRSRINMVKRKILKKSVKEINKELIKRNLKKLHKKH